MSDAGPDSTQEIDTLLADRQRLRGWLERLDSAQDRAPTQVKGRVRADYEGRLAEVVARLRGYSAAITSSLETLRSQRAAYESQRSEVDEVRAEAALRHEVGEYTDEEWHRIDGDAGHNVGGLTGEIDRLTGEINRLDEVLSLVSPPEPPRREPPTLRPVREVRSEERLDIHVLEPEEVTLTARGKHSADDNQNVVTLDPDTLDDMEAIRPEAARPAPPEAPRFTPKGGAEPRSAGRDRGPARTIRFPTQQQPPAAEPTPSGPAVDEMTFLKSVTLDSPASRERAAADQRPSASAARARSPNASKTLKCAECGSMNKPTEWYCERCGAELAAL